MSLFIPTYFSPISQYIEIVKSDAITFEVEDNFQKQSYRNRCYMYGSNGKQLLNIPISHTSSTKRKKTKDTTISGEFPWQRHHFKSLKIAYRSSPFFEFYEDDLAIIFKKNYKYLLDLNIDTFLFFNSALDLDKSFHKTKEYVTHPSQKNFRDLANVKHSSGQVFKQYTQVFDDKYGFIENLSMLDLLFMEGPNAISYL
ncbi:MAG: WbqC family protein [Flavobacteriaceae bacterium]